MGVKPARVQQRFVFSKDVFDLILMTEVAILNTIRLYNQSTMIRHFGAASAATHCMPIRIRVGVRKSLPPPSNPLPLLRSPDGRLR